MTGGRRYLGNSGSGLGERPEDPLERLQIIDNRRHVAITLNAGLNQNHDKNRLLPHHHLYRPNADMEFRDSFSRFKKKVKQRLTGNKPKPDKTGTDAGGVRLDPTGLRSRSEPNLVVGSSYNRERNEANLDGGQVRSTIQLDGPESVPVHGSGTDST